MTARKKKLTEADTIQTIARIREQIQHQLENARQWEYDRRKLKNEIKQLTKENKELREKLKTVEALKLLEKRGIFLCPFWPILFVILITGALKLSIGEERAGNLRIAKERIETLEKELELR